MPLLDPSFGTGGDAPRCNVKEEKAADMKVTKLAESTINADAMRTALGRSRRRRMPTKACPV